MTRSPEKEPPKLVLILEEDPVWRCSMARSLAKVRDLELLVVGTFGDALALLNVESPDLMIFDLDLTEGSGQTLLEGMTPRAPRIPFIFLTGDPDRFRSLVPEQPGLSICRKPVSLAKLRQMVLHHVGARLADSPPRDRNLPFEVSDYVQLACGGQHNVRIEVRNSEGVEGEVVVWEGQLWSAQVGELTGEEAFHRLTALNGARARCESLTQDPGPRSITSAWQGVVVESARRTDDRRVQSIQARSTP